MGRTASTRKTEEPVGSQPAPICRRGEVPSGRSRSTRHTVSSDAGISPSKIAQSAVSPKRKASTSRLTQDYWESSGQQAITACAPHTPDESREKRSSKRSVRLARRDLVTASIPQQVAAVATLPTESGARTLQDAPVPVWSRELMQEATQKLSAADPLLAPLIQEHAAPERLLPTATDSAFHALAHVIMGQQLSVASARNIAQKVKDACGGHEQLQAAAVLELAAPQLLACGLSRQKAAYIADLAQRFHAGTLQTRTVVAMGDEELYEKLTAVKGIGRWSVDMFAMFHCGRLDILPVGDLGVRKGFQALYKLKAIPTDEQMEQIAEKWRPYRSLGSYYMWRVPTVKAVKAKVGAKKQKVKAAVSAVPIVE